VLGTLTLTEGGGGACDEQADAAGGGAGFSGSRAAVPVALSPDGSLAAVAQPAGGALMVCTLCGGAPRHYRTPLALAGLVRPPVDALDGSTARRDGGAALALALAVSPCGAYAVVVAAGGHTLRLLPLASASSQAAARVAAVDLAKRCPLHCPPAERQLGTASAHQPCSRPPYLLAEHIDTTRLALLRRTAFGLVCGRSTWDVAAAMCTLARCHGPKALQARPPSLGAHLIAAGPCSGTLAHQLYGT
jgi:hypothetical protein